MPKMIVLLKDKNPKAFKTNKIDILFIEFILNCYILHIRNGCKYLRGKGNNENVIKIFRVIFLMEKEDFWKILQQGKRPNYNIRQIQS